jgi:hypothetical protein
LLDPNDHALAIDIGRSQTNGLGDAQASGVAGGQNRAMLEARYAIQEVQNFFRTEHYRQFLGLLGHRDYIFEGPGLMQGDLVKKTQSGYGGENGTGS